jgi:hypothetical protein
MSNCYNNEPWIQNKAEGNRGLMLSVKFIVDLIVLIFYIIGMKKLVGGPVLAR